MKSIMRGSLFLALAPFIASCSKQPPTSPTAVAPSNSNQPSNRSTQTSQVGQKLAVTPSDNASQNSKSTTWKFNTNLPEPPANLIYQLKLQQQGQPPRDIGNFTTGAVITADDQSPVIQVTFSPINGPLSQANKMKFLIKKGRNSVSGDTNNFLKGANWFKVEHPARTTGDNTFLLLAFANGKESSGASANTVVFTVRAKP